MTYNSNFTNNYENSEQQMYIAQKRFDKAKLRWKCNKIGFLIIIALLLANLLYTVMELINIAATGAFNLSSLAETTPAMSFANVFAMIAAFFICPLIFCKICKINLADVLPFGKVKTSMLVSLVLIGLSICTIANVASTIIADEFAIFGIENNIDFSDASDTTFQNILYVFTTALEPALAEEFLFRGVILGMLRKHGDGFAIIVSSMLFGLMHGNIAQIPFAFIVGLVLSFVTVKTNSMLPAILIHFFNNFLSVVYDILIYNIGDYMTYIVNYAVTLLILLSALIGIFILCKKNKADSLLKINSKRDDLLTFKEKISCSILNPGTIIFILLCVAECILFVI